MLLLKKYRANSVGLGRDRRGERVRREGKREERRGIQVHNPSNIFARAQLV